MRRINNPLLLVTLIISALVGVTAWTLAIDNLVSSRTPTPQPIRYGGHVPKLASAACNFGKARLGRTIAVNQYGHRGSKRRYLFGTTNWTSKEGRKLNFNAVAFSDPLNVGAPYNADYFAAQFQISGIDLNAQTVQVALDFTNSFRKPFPDGTTYQYEFYAGGATFQGSLSSAFAAGGSAFETFTVPLLGDSSAYPYDSYALVLGGAWITADVPGGGVISFPSDIIDPSASIAESNSLVAYPGMYVEVGSSKEPGGANCLMNAVVAITRAGDSQFIWLMCAIPLIFIALIAELIIRNRKKGTEESQRNGYPLGIEAIGIALAILTILPLRAVLVPSSIATITTVDYFLGAEVATMVALLVGGVYVAARPPPKSRESIAEPSSPEYTSRSRSDS